MNRIHFTSLTNKYTDGITAGQLAIVLAYCVMSGVNMRFLRQQHPPLCNIRGACLGNIEGEIMKRMGMA